MNNYDTKQYPEIEFVNRVLGIQLFTIYRVLIYEALVHVHKLFHIDMS
jgi:hypothetical protein